MSNAYTLITQSIIPIGLLREITISASLVREDLLTNDTLPKVTLFREDAHVEIVLAAIWDISIKLFHKQDSPTFPLYTVPFLYKIG